MVAPFTIALAGNPNCGKTTLFNALTGMRYKVANYPGVTVEKRTGRLRAQHGEGRDSDTQSIEIWDLPGTYSLNGSSLDEGIATAALLGTLHGISAPDAIIVVLDASCIERNLYLCTQLIDLGLPTLVALTMGDVARASGSVVRTELLAAQLGVPVIAVQASSGQGIATIINEIRSLALNREIAATTPRFAWIPDADITSVVSDLGRTLAGSLCDSRIHPTMVGLLLLGGAIPAPPAAEPALHRSQEQLHAKGLEGDSFEAEARYRWIGSIVRAVVSNEPYRRPRTMEFLDWVTIHRVWGLILFTIIMAMIFQSVFLWASIPMELMDTACSAFGSFVGSRLPTGLIRSLIVDGIIAGVGSVIVFVPQIALLFFFLGLLEESGYLARAAFLMDRLLRPFGLQGRSFIPLLSSFACAIPGIMSTRTIPSLGDRIRTILVAPFMSCSARIPVYTLLIAAVIPAHFIGGIIPLQGMAMVALYLLGILGGITVSWVLTLIWRRAPVTPFVMEMPPFRLPSLRIVLREVLDRVILFLRNAGTIILACSVVLWFLATFPRGDIQESFAGYAGRIIEPVIAPLGFNWEIGIGLLTSFAAREVFVSTLATVYNLQDSDGEHGSLLHELSLRFESGEFTLATGLSLLVFYVFACQCISTLAITRRETGSWRWVILMFSVMTAMAYGASFLTYQITHTLTQ